MSFQEFNWIDFLIDSGENVVEKWTADAIIDDSKTGYHYETKKVYMINCTQHSGYIMINFGSMNHNRIYSYDRCFDNEKDCQEHCEKLNSIEEII